MKNKYIPVIGLEVHVELKTKSKMFCGCDASYFGEEPNSHTCPVCLGLPGALPVPNKKAIEWCLKIGMALNCKIPLVSKFDRKNYFYPDLAKGYQISQYDQPFAENGWIELTLKDEKKKKVRIRRVHMEEDTGKLLHETINGEKVSLIDFNRSGVPLVEIVTEPDFESAEEVKAYLKKLQQIIRYLEVSDADMEKGQMRLEPNISLREFRIQNSEFRIDENLPSYKVEVKNINSFNFVEDAIEFEIKRQSKILDEGKLPTQETRGWNEDRKESVSQRSKEDAMDYRYFPEPDIPPIKWKQEQVDNLKSQMPELPDVKIERYVKDYGVTYYNAEIIAREKKLAEFFEKTIEVCEELKNKKENSLDYKTITNWIINKKIDPEKILPAEFVTEILKATKVEGIDEAELESILKKIIDGNEKVVNDYKSGKENAIMFLVGQAMRELKGKVKADEVKEKLQDLLK